MQAEQYAVIKEAVGLDSYKFKKWHDNKLDAQEEAVRLSGLEKCKFLVVKVVGYAENRPNPVEYFVV